MKTLHELAIEYSKSIYQEEYDDPTFAPDVFQTKNDFAAGYKAAQEWISVADELPNEIINTVEDEVNGNTLYFYEHYIVKGYFKNKAKTESTWIGVYRPCSSVWYFQVVKPQNTVDFVITHWRPINNE